MSFLRDPKRLIATIIAGVAGLIVLVDFAGAIPNVDPVARLIIDWAAVLGALALIVGLLNVTIGHIARVVKRQPDWYYSLVLLIAMLLVIITGTLIGFWNDGGELKMVIAPNSLVEQPIRDIFRAFYEPLAGAFLALLAFFSLSAALRAVHRRTVDALVILIVATIVLALSALPQAGDVPAIGTTVGWVRDYIALAGARGLIIGAAIGAVVAGARVLLGFDQPYLDR